MEDVQLEKVAICKMGVKKVVDVHGNQTGEEYEVEEERSIPSTSVKTDHD